MTNQNGAALINGSHSNGVQSPPERIGPQQMINRTEFIRVLIHSLGSLGLHQAASQLEKESGVQSQSPLVRPAHAPSCRWAGAVGSAAWPGPPARCLICAGDAHPSLPQHHSPACGRCVQVNELQESVLRGDWACATDCLTQLDLAGRDQLKAAKFIILEQAFLEAVELGDTPAAIRLLRGELAPLGVNPERLHELAACLLCRGREEVRRLAGGPPAASCEEARQAVLRRLQAVIPAEVMLPDRRLEALVEQALSAQLSRCLYHNSPAALPSLLTDYECGREQIPTVTTQVGLEARC